MPNPTQLNSPRSGLPRFVASRRCQRAMGELSVRLNKSMWQHKTLEELAAARQKKRHARLNPFIPLIFALLASGFSTINIWLGFRGKYNSWGAPIPWQQAISSFPYFFIVSFILIYIFRIFDFGLANSSTTSICNSCHEVTGHCPGTLCSCGGCYEPFEDWKWIPEKKPNKEHRGQTLTRPDFK